jgi:uncharacterized membrane protein YkvA (DUF1232 family)
MTLTDQERSEVALDADVLVVTRGFGPKIRKVLGKVPFVGDAVAMYYAMLDLETPFWVKGTLAAALMYFIAPLDAIPDVFQLAGFADDATLLYVTLQLVREHVSADHLAKARRFLQLDGDG